MCYNVVHSALYSAKSVTGDTRIMREFTMNRIPIDDWVIEVTYEALPGTSYNTQRRLVGDILSPELKAAVQGAANAFADAVKAELNSVRTAIEENMA